MVCVVFVGEFLLETLWEKKNKVCCGYDLDFPPRHGLIRGSSSITAVIVISYIGFQATQLGRYERITTGEEERRKESLYELFVGPSWRSIAC